MSWLSKIRLKVIAYLTGLTLAALGILAVTTIPAWGVWGVAVAAAAMVVHRTTGRLSQATCYGCGRSSDSLPDGEHGFVCPDCGTICSKPGKIKNT